MAFLLEQHGTLSDIRLEGSAGIADAAELKGLLQEASRAGFELRLDLRKAEDVDVCILQLLVCADRQWRRIGLRFTILGPLLDGVNAAIANAGLDALHEIPIASDAGLLCEV